MAGPQNIPVVGSFFENPNEEAKLQGMRQAGQVYAANRPQVAQARQNALASQMFAYQPAMNAMALMYGPAGAMQPSMMARSPFTGATPGPPPIAAGPAAAAPEPAGGGGWGPSGAMATLRTELGGRPIAGGGGWGPSGGMARLRTELGGKPIGSNGGWGPSGAVHSLNRVSREADRRQRAEASDASSGSGGKFGGFYK